MDMYNEISAFFINASVATIDIYDAVGFIGFGLYIINYSLVTFHIIDSRKITFFSINIIAAGCVLISLAQNFNLASALIQVCWIGLGVVAIILRLSSKHKSKQKALKLQRLYASPQL